MKRQRGLLHAKRVLCRNRTCRNGRLRCIGRSIRSYHVQLREAVRQLKTVSLRRGGVLIFAADIEREASLLVQRGDARDVIEAFLVWPPVVVYYRLSKVVTVTKRRARDAQHSRVDALNSIDRSTVPPLWRCLNGKFSLQTRKYLLPLIRPLHNSAARRLQGVNHAHPRHRTHPTKDGVSKTNGI